MIAPRITTPRPRSASNVRSLVAVCSNGSRDSAGPFFCSDYNCLRFAACNLVGRGAILNFAILYRCSYFYHGQRRSSIFARSAIHDGALIPI